MPLSLPLVLKFGGSVLRHAADYDGAAAEIHRLARPTDLPEQRVVAIISAGFGESNHRYADEPSFADDERGFITHVAQGEIASCERLAGALRERGLPCGIVRPHETGIVTAQAPRDAVPHGFDERFVTDRFDGASVVLVPGHIGTDHQSGSLSLLGRGGSDLSAVIIASGLGAVCRIYKDVPGVLDEHGDPIAALTWDDLASEIPSINGSAVLQDRAVEYARAHGVVAEVGAIGAKSFTRIASPKEPRRRA